MQTAFTGYAEDCVEMPRLDLQFSDEKKTLLPFLVNSNCFKSQQLNLNYAQRIVLERINTAVLANGVKKQNKQKNQLCVLCWF